MKIKTNHVRSEAYHAEKDGKEFQVEVRLEDGTANDPKKCTVIIDGEETTVDVKNGEDALKKAVKAGAEKLGFKIVEGYYDNGPTIADVRRYLERTMKVKVGVLKDILQSALSELRNWDINDEVEASPNSDNMDEFIALGHNSYVPLGNFKITYASEAESKKSEERMSYAELKADALKRIGAGPFTSEEDLDDSIMSTLDAMPYDIPEGTKQALGSDLFEILWDDSIVCSDT